MYGFVGGVAPGASRSSQFAGKAVAAPRSARAVASRRTAVSMSLDTGVSSSLINIAEGGGMSVTFGAYLAVLLGTLIPVAFLVILYIQAEARKSGERNGPSE